MHYCLSACTGDVQTLLLNVQYSWNEYHVHLGSFQLYWFIHLSEQPPDQRGSDDQGCTVLVSPARLSRAWQLRSGVKGKVVLMGLNRNLCFEGIQLITNFTWSFLSAPIGKHTKTSFLLHSLHLHHLHMAVSQFGSSWRYEHFVIGHFFISHCSLIGSARFFGKEQTRIPIQSYPAFFPLHVAHSLSLSSKTMAFCGFINCLTPDNCTVLAVLTLRKLPRLSQGIIFLFVL